MKNTIFGLIALTAMAFLLAGCPEAVVTYDTLAVVGWFSYPTIYLTDGSSNFSNPNSPVTGTDKTNATVTVTNDTTGVSTTAAYVAASPHGYY